MTTHRIVNHYVCEIYRGGREFTAHPTPESIIKAYSMRHQDREWILDTLKKDVLIEELEYLISQE